MVNKSINKELLDFKFNEMVFFKLKIEILVMIIIRVEQIIFEYVFR